jgi:hypothetical protein
VPPTPALLRRPLAPPDRGRAAGVGLVVGVAAGLTAWYLAGLLLARAPYPVARAAAPRRDPSS